MVKNEYINALFVRLGDIAKPASGKEHRDDFLDYRLNYEFVNRIKEDEDLALVCLLEHDGTTALWGLPEERDMMVGIVSNVLAVLSGKAVKGYISDRSLEDALAYGVQFCKKNQCFKDKKHWIILDCPELAEKYKIANITMEELLDDSTTDNAGDEERKAK